MPNIVRPQRLDAVDREIVRILSTDGRMPNKELADRVGLAPSSCLARVRALVESKVISGFHAEIDPARIGKGIRAIVQVKLNKHTRVDNARFAADMTALPQVINLWLMSGEVDYLIEVATSTPDSLSDFVLDHVTSHPIVADSQTMLAFARWRGPGPIPTEDD